MKIFYTPSQSVPRNESYSPSAGKPELIVKQWQERWPEKVEVVPPEPARREELYLAHDPRYVESVLSCRGENGFGNKDPQIAKSLPWTTGSLLSASRHALKNGSVACSPTSGFHHASYRTGDGYCTFNGLVVAALALKDEGARVGILDLDVHFGDGTENILKEKNHGSIPHLSTPPNWEDHPASGFLDALPSRLKEFEVDLLLYQAGADPHVDDPLGGWMTSEQMRRRDRIVFEHCRSRGIPVVWNLAGGYQEDFQRVLDLHHATMEECLDIFEQ